jgi:hypothetical protein
LIVLKTQLKRIRENFSADELVVLGLILSVFMTIYLTVASMAAVLACLAWRKKLLPLLASTPKFAYLLIFCFLTILVSSCRFNGQGILTAIGMLIYFIIAVYIRQVMTRKLFEAAVKVCCAASLLSVAVIAVQTVLAS